MTAIDRGRRETMLARNVPSSSSSRTITSRGPPACAEVFVRCHQQATGAERRDDMLHASSRSTFQLACSRCTRSSHRRDRRQVDDKRAQPEVVKPGRWKMHAATRGKDASLKPERRLARQAAVAAQPGACRSPAPPDLRLGGVRPAAMGARVLAVTAVGRLSIPASRLAREDLPALTSPQMATRRGRARRCSVRSRARIAGTAAAPATPRDAACAAPAAAGPSP